MCHGTEKQPRHFLFIIILFYTTSSFIIKNEDVKTSQIEIQVLDAIYV